MKAYQPKSFQRAANAEGVADPDCREALRRAEKGLIDADLGGGLIKQRIPRRNQGAARGLRAVLFYKRGELAIFLHLFAKSAKANLTKSELAEYRKLAGFLDSLTEAQFEELSAKRGWKELVL